MGRKAFEELIGPLNPDAMEGVKGEQEHFAICKRRIECPTRYRVA
jgi:hypothetical protein